MALRHIDLHELGRVLGYTPGQMSSIKQIRIEPSQVTVTRFVQDPEESKPKRVFVFQKTTFNDDTGEFEPGYSNLIHDEIFYWVPVEHDEKPEPEYLRLSKSAVKVLKQLQSNG